MDLIVVIFEEAGVSLGGIIAGLIALALISQGISCSEAHTERQKAADAASFTQHAQALDEEAFPDQALRAAVAEQADTDGDGKLGGGEIGSVTELDLSDRGITDLSGIEAFPNLEVLDASDNALDGELAFSDFRYDEHNSHLANLRHVDLSGNSLKRVEVDVPVEYLDVSGNSLERTPVFDARDEGDVIVHLDLSDNAIENGDVEVGPQCQYLDLSDNVSIYSLQFSGTMEFSDDVPIWEAGRMQTDALADMQYLHCENVELKNIEGPGAPAMVSAARIPDVSFTGCDGVYSATYDDLGTIYGTSSSGLMLSEQDDLDYIYPQR